MPTKARSRDEKSSDKAGAVEKPDHLDKAVSKKKKFTCPICEDHIVDGSQRSIWCDGECAIWRHSGCAGPSKTAHAKLTTPFSVLTVSCRLRWLNWFH